jgi:hypothetical protein
MINPFHHLPDHQKLDHEQCKNAKVYGSREDFIKTLPHDIEFIEVGVAAGDFSEFIMDTCKPKRAVLIDIYTEKDLFFLEPGLTRYTGEENLDFVTNRMKKYSGVEIVQKDSLKALPELVTKNELFDFIYIDASHEYKNVILDIESSCHLLKEYGILGLNDYIWKDENGTQYGVIPAVNKFLEANKDWEIIAFAFHDRMYADVYLRRIMP